MNAIYRPIPAEDMPLFRKYDRTNFAEGENKPPAKPDTQPDPYEVGMHRGVYTPGDGLVAQLYARTLAMRCRGVDIDTAGLGYVSCRAEFRRQGYTSFLMKETLRELKDSGITMSALYPFHFGFYRKLGWELAGHTVRSYMSFDEIAWARPGNGKFVALEASDWPRMNNAYETYRWLFNGASPRTTELAEKISVTPFWGPIPFILGYEEAGQITGFLTWYGGEVSGEIYKRELRVNQFVYSTPQAAEGLLAGIINLSAQFKQLRMQLPAEDPIWWMIGNPRQTRSEFVPEGMIRIVDLSALSVPRYPEWLRGEVNLSVTDKSAPWNEGTIAVAVEGGVLTIRASSQPAEAEVSIQALSQMFYGVEDASGLAAVGQLKATEPAIGLFNALWPKQRVWFSEHF